MARWRTTRRTKLGSNYVHVLNKVDNIIVNTVDYNKKQIDGSLENVLDLGDLKAKFESFGWMVFEEERGNDMESVLNVLNGTEKENLKKESPIVILLYTEMGNGVDYMMGTHKWHGSLQMMNN